jgi:hypothetical protein
MAEEMTSVATLRIIGDSLVPDEVTRLLGCEPSRAEAKGDVISKKTGRKWIARSGGWRLDAEDRTPDDLEGQILGLLARLNSDLEVWASLADRFRLDVFCGLFMAKRSEALSLSPSTLHALGSRHIELALCLYDPTPDDNGPR